MLDLAIRIVRVLGTPHQSGKKLRELVAICHALHSKDDRLLIALIAWAGNAVREMWIVEGEGEPSDLGGLNAFQMLVGLAEAVDSTAVARARSDICKEIVGSQKIYNCIYAGPGKYRKDFPVLGRLIDVSQAGRLVFGDDKWYLFDGTKWCPYKKKSVTIRNILGETLGGCAAHFSCPSDSIMFSEEQRAHEQSTHDAGKRHMYSAGRDGVMKYVIEATRLAVDGFGARVKASGVEEFGDMFKHIEKRVSISTAPPVIACPHSYMHIFT